MKIDQIVRSIKSFKMPLRAVNTTLDATNINFYGHWRLGICGKNNYGKNDDSLPYTVICGYGKVVQNDDGYEIQSASTSYFPEANAYLTYSILWCDFNRMTELLRDVRLSGSWYMGISYFPPLYERICYKT